MRRYFKVRGQGTSGSGLLALLWRYARAHRGNVGPLTALLIVPLIGAIGIGTELTSWFLTQRAMQNAADSAAIAAATNGENGGSDFTTEAQSVAANYGFTNSANDTTVSVSFATISGISACASTSCYSVTIKKAVPIYFLQIVGYSSNVGSCSGSGNVQCLTAAAVASGKAVNAQVCLLTTGTGTDISSNGSSKSNVNCGIMSNGDVNCNGHPITSGVSDSVDTPKNNKGCGNTNISGLTAATDVYQSVLTNNPPSLSTCTSNGTYPEGNSHWPAGNTISGNVTWGSTVTFCGDVKLSSNVNVTSASPGTVMVIANGMLDLNGNTLATESGSALTIIFTCTGTCTDDYTSGTAVNSNTAGGNMTTGSGTLDFNAPTTGTWAGIAMIQNGSLPTENITYAGNSPTWEITGVLDFPTMNLSASGAVNKSSNGFSCLVIVANTYSDSGNNDLYYVNPVSQCAQAGVAQILEPGATIGELVY